MPSATEEGEAVEKEADHRHPGLDHGEERLSQEALLTCQQSQLPVESDRSRSTGDKLKE